MHTRFNYYQDGRAMLFAGTAVGAHFGPAGARELGAAVRAEAAFGVDIGVDSAGNIGVVLGALDPAQAAMALAHCSGALDLPDGCLMFLNGPVEGGDTVRVDVPAGRYLATLWALPGSPLDGSLLQAALPPDPVGCWQQAHPGAALPHWLVMAASEDPEGMDPTQAGRWEGEEMEESINAADDALDELEDEDGPLTWLLQLVPSTDPAPQAPGRGWRALAAVSPPLAQVPGEPGGVD